MTNNKNNKINRINQLTVAEKESLYYWAFGGEDRINYPVVEDGKGKLPADFLEKQSN